MIQFNNTERALRLWGEAFRDRYRDNNVRAGYDPAAELQNIRFKVFSDKGNFEIDFQLPDYWYYAENGRGPGKMPPKGSLLEWMQFKQILPSPMTLRSGRTVLPSMNSLEFLIRRKIGRDGTEGSHTWKATEDQMRDSLVRDVKAALEKDLREYAETMK